MENFPKLPLKLRQFLFFDNLKLKKFARTSILVLHILTLTLFGLLCFATTFQKPFKFEIVINGLMMSTITIGCIVKFIFVSRNFEKLKALTKSFKNSYVEFKRRKFKIFFKLYCGFAFIQLPVAARECFMKVLQGNFEFPLYIKFPFDTSRPAVHTIAMLCLLYAHILLLLIHNTCDIFIYEIIFNLSMEFKVLRRKFEAVKVPTLENLKRPKVIVIGKGVKELKPFVDEVRVEKLLKLFNEHKKLLINLKKLKKVLEIPFAFNFTVSALIIGLILLRMTIADSSAMIPLAFGLIMSFNKIFLQCSFGQLLMNSCEKVSEGIYGSSWEDFEDEKIRKMIVVAIKRAQKGDGFKIMKFIKVDLEQFVVVRERNYLRSLYICN